MAGAQQQQGGGGADNSLSALWLTVLFFLTVGLIWYFFQAEIVGFWFKVKLFELYFVDLFTDEADDIIRWIQETDPGSVSFKELSAISFEVGNYLSYPAAGLLMILAMLTYLNNAKTRFTRTFSMETKARYEVRNWPQIAPVLDLSLVDQHIEEGVWAMAETPMQFALRHKLLTDVDGITSNDYARRMKSVAKVDRKLARQVFALQLGPLWEGIHKLPPHVRALFAIFAAKANRDRDSASSLLEQISRSTQRKKYDFSGADALLRKHLQEKGVMKIMQRHAYVYTVMASMLEYARDDGVMASADFLWLKPIDRRLWYVLNTIGRHTAVCEVAGIYAHWLAEKELIYPLRVPVVKEAVVGLETAIASQIYLPDDVKS